MNPTDFAQDFVQNLATKDFATKDFTDMVSISDTDEESCTEYEELQASTSRMASARPEWAQRSGRDFARDFESSSTIDFETCHLDEEQADADHEEPQVSRPGMTSECQRSGRDFARDLGSSSTEFEDSFYSCFEVEADAHHEDLQASRTGMASGRPEWAQRSGRDWSLSLSYLHEANADEKSQSEEAEEEPQVSRTRMTSTRPEWAQRSGRDFAKESLGDSEKSISHQEEADGDHGELQASRTRMTSSRPEWAQRSGRDFAKESLGDSKKSLSHLEKADADAHEEPQVLKKAHDENSQSLCKEQPSASAASTKKLDRDRKYMIFRWYSKLGHPSRESMKKQLHHIPANITEEEVDELPWMSSGRLIHAKKMNEILFHD
jgi:hypothetical protein